MRSRFVFITVFVLLFVLTAEGRAEVSALWSMPQRPIFSTDTDFFLGQKKRGYRAGGRIWTNFYYGDTTLKPTEGGKIRPDFYGFQIGLDLEKSRGIYTTYFLNINQSNTDFGGADSDINNFLLGYGKYYYLSICYFALTGSIGYDKYEVSLGGTHKGDGLQTNFFGEFGLDFPLGKWSIKPFYALQYDFLYHGNIGSVIADNNDHGLEQLFGLRLGWKTLDWLELQSRAVWVHEMLSKPPPFYRARFSPVSGIGTPAIMFYNGNTGRDWIWLGIGGKIETVVSVFFDYDLLINERHITHIGSLGLCLNW